MGERGGVGRRGVRRGVGRGVGRWGVGRRT